MNNEWVPELGTECEYKTNPANNDWIRCKVIFITRFGSYLVEVCGTTEMLLPRRTEFRAIKTEAEKRRDLAVAEMKSDYRETQIVKTAFDDSFCEKLIDAGWVKPKPLTFDVVKQIWFEAASEVMESPPQMKFAKAIEAYIRGEG